MFKIAEKIMEHNGRDVNFHLLKHHIEKEYQCLQNKNFLLLAVIFGVRHSKKKDF